MAERISPITSTPRPMEGTGRSDSEEDSFIGFGPENGSYREVEEDISSIDESFYEQETILQGEVNTTREKDESEIIFKGDRRRINRERKAKGKKTKKEDEMEESKEPKTSKGKR